MLPVDFCFVSAGSELTPVCCCSSDQWGLGHGTRYTGVVGVSAQRKSGLGEGQPETYQSGGLLMVWRTLSVYAVGECQRLRLVCAVSYVPVGVTPGICFGGFLKSHCPHLSKISSAWCGFPLLGLPRLQRGLHPLWIQTGLSGSDWDMVGVRLEIALSWTS